MESRSTVRFGAVAALLLLAVAELAWGIAAAPVVSAAAAGGPTLLPGLSLGPSLTVGGIVVLGSIAVAAATSGAAIGVATGSRAGWWLGVVASAAWSVSACSPIALAALGVLWLPDVRAVALPPPR